MRQMLVSIETGASYTTMTNASSEPMWLSVCLDC